MKKVNLLWITFFITVNIGLAYDLAAKKIKCPLCGTFTQQNIITRAHVSSFRLDFMPIGDIMAPDHLPQCPKCGFVICQTQLSAALKDSLQTFINSPVYQKAIADNTPYGLLAVINTYRTLNPGSIAFNYLMASWEAESTPALCQTYREQALTYNKQFLELPGKISDEDKLIAWLLYGEMLRLLGRFEEAQ